MRKHVEPSRVRSNGTVVTEPKTGLERIAAFRSIVSEKQYAKIDGVMIDLFSASAVLQVYDAISPENQIKFASTNAPFMVMTAFKVIKKVQGA